MSAEPIPSSLVVLLRPGPVLPEVFLVRRPGAARFMGGAWVFPGGKVDPEDAALGVRIDEPAPVPSAFEDASERAHPARVAAIRELFEEAGVLLACPASGPDPAWSRGGLDAHRRALSEGTRFGAVLAEEGLEPAVERLVPVAHWVTPSASPMRFDALTFVAELPAGQVASSDERETHDGRWLTAQAALAMHERGEGWLPPPTELVLREIAACTSVAQVLALARQKPVYAILPKAVGQGAVLMPWAEDYRSTEGEGRAVPADLPERALPSRVAPPEPKAAPEVPAEALRLLHAWFGPDLSLAVAPPEVQAKWWTKDPDHDAALKREFGELVEQAAGGALDGWLETPEGTLALVLLLDQLPRNLFRGQARAFATDARAVELSCAAIARGDDLRLSTMLAAFFYLPLMHAEDMREQNACVLAFARLAEANPGFESNLGFAHKHRDLVARFGRFPYRNAVVKRPSTPDELEWLAAGNQGF